MLLLWLILCVCVGSETGKVDLLLAEKGKGSLFHSTGHTNSPTATLINTQFSIRKPSKQCIKPITWKL